MIEEDRAGPGVEAVFGGDAQPNLIVAVGFEGDRNGGFQVTAWFVRGQAEDPQAAFQAAGVEYRVAHADIRQVEAAGDVVGVDFQRAGGTVIEPGVEAAEVARGQGVPGDRTVTL